MTLKQLQDAWQADQALTLDQPELMVRDVPLLHARWWKYYTEERSRLTLLKADYDSIRRARWEWYLGRLDEAERKKLEWPPQALLIVRQDVDTYLAADTVLQPLKINCELQETKVKFLEDVIKHINNRGYLIRSYVDYLRFSQGA